MPENKIRTNDACAAPYGEILAAAPENKWNKAAWVAAACALSVGLHWATPVGPHDWHWLHLFAQKLLFVPVLMAAVWFGAAEVFGTALLVTAAFLVHILRDWAGFPMIQADQLAELVNIWGVAPAAWLYFENERRATRRLRKAHADTLLTMIASLELREPYTAGHSRRVAAYSALIAEKLGIKDEVFLRDLAAGALLHDIGKIGVPDSVLLKAGGLDERERALIRVHPAQGAALIGEADAFVNAVPVIKGHHERYDGRGYPGGLAGEAIPLGARIVAVADVYDALTTERPYKKALTHDEAVAAIEKDAGKAFDPAVAAAFCAMPRPVAIEPLPGRQ